LKKNLEVISLIYKSTEYLEFIYNQLKEISVDGWDIGYRIVANDANHNVLSKLNELGAKHTIYKDESPDDFYLNRVYRCWNHSVVTSEYDNVCLVNSDMLFSDDWLSNLLRYHDGKHIPCSRLVESGKMPSGLHGISKNFGRRPKNLDIPSWNKFVKNQKSEGAHLGGLYMPCIFNRKTFLESGGYPPGNLFLEDEKLVVGYPNDRPVWASGDQFFFYRLEKDQGLKHITVFDSLVYHIQEGEMDE
jgi:hypothetical protein